MSVINRVIRRTEYEGASMSKTTKKITKARIATCITSVSVREIRMTRNAAQCPHSLSRIAVQITISNVVLIEPSQNAPRFTSNYTFK
jgi:hypothetical protein